jgi:hypothetical protein
MLHSSDGHKSTGVFAGSGKFLEKNPGAFPFILDEDRSDTKSYWLYFTGSAWMR